MYFTRLLRMTEMILPLLDKSDSNMVILLFKSPELEELNHRLSPGSHRIQGHLSERSGFK